MRLVGARLVWAPKGWDDDCQWWRSPVCLPVPAGFVPQQSPGPAAPWSCFCGPQTDKSLCGMLLFPGTPRCLVRERAILWVNGHCWGGLWVSPSRLPLLLVCCWHPPQRVSWHLDSGESSSICFMVPIPTKPQATGCLL